MGEILLVGPGPLPGEGAREGSFGQLRLWGFLKALRGAGHGVRLALIGKGRGDDWLDPDDPAVVTRLRSRKAGVDAIVAAGPYLPGYLACLAAEEEPVWADLPGDPLAELQAAVLAGAADDARRAAAHAAATAVLARADAIAAISRRQRMACLGQLGALGRLGVDEGAVVSVPIAYDLPFPKGKPRRGGVALSGSFNTWFDDAAAAAGLEAALARDRALTVTVTGGGVSGHYTQGYARFQRWAQASAHRERIHLRGWLPEGELPAALAGAGAGLCIDRAGWEPILGSRTRVLLWSWLGLGTIATARCELLAEMSAANAIYPLLSGAPAPVADAIARADGPALAAAANAFLAAHYSPERCYAPLLAWAAAPRRQPPAPAAAELPAEVARLKAELARVHASPTWRLLARVHRWFGGLRG